MTGICAFWRVPEGTKPGRPRFSRTACTFSIAQKPVEPRHPTSAKKTGYHGSTERLDMKHIHCAACEASAAAGSPLGAQPGRTRSAAAEMPVHSVWRLW